jgi:glyoxylase-like metal-dependent hydrolase (beta-lactamase superfamily II)
MLYEASARLLLVADQVLAKISPNVSVSPVDPNGDPLGLYLRSLAALRRDIAPDALVLAGHGLPLFGLHERIEQLVAHHEARCAALFEACRAEPRSPAQLISAIFPQELDPHQMGFAFNELLAHINAMLRVGTLRRAPPKRGATQIVAAL